MVNSEANRDHSAQTSTSTATSDTSTLAYTSNKPWNPSRPHTLVIACSDGRLQENIDEFLENYLGIRHYDRMYIPGGPGALASTGFEFVRPDQLRRECAFLIEAHSIESIILIFHGPSADGPDEAMCADYCRKWPSRPIQELRQQQQDDVADLLHIFRWPLNLRVRAFRAEVTHDGTVQFVDLNPPQS